MAAAAIAAASEAAMRDQRGSLLMELGLRRWPRLIVVSLHLSMLRQAAFAGASRTAVTATDAAVASMGSESNRNGG